MPSFNGKKKTAYQNKIIQSVIKYRLKRGIGQSKIAKLIDRTHQTVSLIEKSDSPNIYSINQLLIICKECDINISYLFMDNEDVFNKKSKWEILDLLVQRIGQYENNKR